MAFEPNALTDNANVLWYQAGDTSLYENGLQALGQAWNKSTEQVAASLSGKYGSNDLYAVSQALKDEGIEIGYNSNGYRCYAYKQNFTTNLPNTQQLATTNSNTSITTTNASATTMFDTTVDTVEGSPTFGKVLVNPVGSLLTPEHGFYGWKYFGIECSQALDCVGWGIKLGKFIDSTLYNANPDFWDSHGMSSLNPETWNNITNGDDSIFAGLFNAILGLNPDSGEAQMFLDEDALAYISYYMKTQGAFDPASYYEGTYNGSVSGWSNTPTQPLQFGIGSRFYLGQRSASTSGYKFNFSQPVYGLQYGLGDTTTKIFLSSTPFTYSARWGSFSTHIAPDTNAASGTTTNGTTFYYVTGGNSAERYPRDSVAPRNNATNVVSVGSLVVPTATILFDGDVHPVGGVEGITDQPGATLPNITTWNDVPTTLSSLQQQYPDMWADAVPNTIVQPDGSTKTITYVPIGMPSATNQYDTQPTTGTQTQTSPSVESAPANADLMQLIMQLVTQPETNPNITDSVPGLAPPEINPINTGEGESPVPVIPEGYASALWSVYHPTQAQVDAFGGWLWTGNIITQIQQLLQNPMDGIITLHKIFAPPVDAGEGTIVIGRLDSEVPSAVVNQQYVEVDCGSVDCSEQFGNVFDYVGTKVSLYLPFIGIVPLNVSEVMRSTINIKYGVDIFTGACLAMVYVSRDGNTVNMYQYSGVASVEYPITAGLHMGILNSIIGVASGIAMIGSTTTPMGGIMGAISLAHGVVAADTVSQSHSGGFSGNAGAMGIKIPYLIIERPQTKVASTFPYLDGYPTNYSVTLGSCSNHVKCSTVHVSGINATEKELSMIEALLKEGVEV